MQFQMIFIVNVGLFWIIFYVACFECLNCSQQNINVCFSKCRTLMEKSAVGRLLLLVTVSKDDIQIHYGIHSKHNFSISMKTAGHISIGHWTHMALQVGSMFLFSYFFLWSFICVTYYSRQQKQHVTL